MCAMNRKRLGPPLDGERLSGLFDALRSEGWTDPTETFDWLRRHSDKRAMMSAVAEAWRRSPLPLAEMSNRVEDVEVRLTNSGDVLLLLRADGRAFWQATPFTSERLRTVLGGEDWKICSIVKDVATSTPGFSIEGNGSLCLPEFFEDPLGEARGWLRGTTPEGLIEHGSDYLDPDRHVIELARNVYGDLYLLGVDESVWFLEHEEPELFRCEFSLEVFLNTYVLDPDKIDHPSMITG